MLKTFFLSVIYSMFIAWNSILGITPPCILVASQFWVDNLFVVAYIAQCLQVIWAVSKYSTSCEPPPRHKHPDKNMLTYIAAYDIFSEIYSDSFGDLYSVKILTSLLWLANIFIYFLLNLKCNKFVDKTFDIINYSDSLLISLNFNCTKLADTFMLYYLTTTSWLSPVLRCWVDGLRQWVGRGPNGKAMVTQGKCWKMIYIHGIYVNIGV